MEILATCFYCTKQFPANGKKCCSPKCKIDKFVQDYLHGSCIACAYQGETNSCVSGTFGCSASHSSFAEGYIRGYQQGEVPTIMHGCLACYLKDGKAKICHRPDKGCCPLHRSYINGYSHALKQKRKKIPFGF